MKIHTPCYNMTNLIMLPLSEVTVDVNLVGCDWCSAETKTLVLFVVTDVVVVAMVVVVVGAVFVIT
jgi:hypothetical protein